MKTTKAFFAYGAVIGLACFGIYYLLIPMLFNKLWAFISDDTISLFISAFLGGFSAGLFTYYFNSKSRLRELRHTKYFEHRNTIVQIEHELVGTRANLSRNLESIKLALDVRDERYRFILRFFNLDVTSGLSLKLLDLDLINKYSEVYIIFQNINSDLEYLKSMVEQIRQNVDINQPKPTHTIISLMDNYVTMIDHVYNQLIIADKMSLELVAKCKMALVNNSEIRLKEYINKGGEIKYLISKADINKKVANILREENKPGSNKNPRPKFIALYFDLYRE